MKKKNYSLNKLFMVYFAAILALMTVSMLFLGFYSVFTYYQQIQSNNSASLDVYANNLENDMEHLQAFNEELYGQNNDFKMLTTDYCTAGERLVCEYNLRNLIRGNVLPYGAIMIFDETDTTDFYWFGVAYPASSNKKNAELKNYMKEYWRASETNQFYKWIVYEENGYSLLVSTYRYKELYVCSVIDLQMFASYYNNFEEDQPLRIAFFREDQILTDKEGLEKMQIGIEKLQGRTMMDFKYIIQQRQIAGTDIFISCIMPINYLWNYSRVSVFVIAAVSALILLLIWFVFSSIRKLMLYPLNQIASASQLLERGQDETMILPQDSGAAELLQINQALNELMRQKVNLTDEKTQREMERDHAQLQYFQLQTKSHFFVNCLKSLYNMLGNKEYERMQRMIIAFSNHLRYLFHDNLSVVPLRAELEEVNDYYSIISLDRKKPVFLQKNIKEELLDCMVPPLLVQTFLENSIKYNGNSEKPLRFSIQADMVKMNDRAFLKIRMSDNGVGYSADILEKLNSPQEEMYEKYHVGVSNLRKRIRLIYQSDFQMAFYNEPMGGACTVICLPLMERAEER